MRLPLPPQRKQSTTSRSSASENQAMPLGRYYDILLTDPPPYRHLNPLSPPSSAAQEPKEPAESLAPANSEENPPSFTSPTPTPPPADAAEKARIVFGSPLAGPAARRERLRKMREKGKMVAGVLVPPKPEEPDHCCMSGCVDCVWDTFREEMEAWLAANAEAEKRLAASAASKKSVKKPSPSPVQGTAVSMDDDGGGSETNWDLGEVKPAGVKIFEDLWSDELYRDIPVGIREFMKQEKRLKEKHKREGTAGG
ncbi:uncharacterized protein PpBr36_10278 [Pyricularia pennisetigena]|uniref:uncharacterized protein n=1 Tax=Pyricularia pennisetigena TaxID=1578925 RepID=UPI0011549DE4|nr:uncharacterized protein PpBr36_10278 [Pyricularia pennisetigena]TLS21535.1 hypothetical protein PpBr36_10278 [Pyricularia pennisetigena]